MSFLTNYLELPNEVSPHAEFSKLLSQFKFKLVCYVDNILFLSYMSFEETECHISTLRFIFQCFGVAINLDKSVLVPSKQGELLGFLVGTDKMELTTTRIAKVR